MWRNSDLMYLLTWLLVRQDITDVFLFDCLVLRVQQNSRAVCFPSGSIS